MEVYDSSDWSNYIKGKFACTLLHLYVLHDNNIYDDCFSSCITICILSSLGLACILLPDPIPVFVHDGHDEDSSVTRILAHDWYHFNDRMVISTATDGSLHAWQFNVC